MCQFLLGTVQQDYTMTRTTKRRMCQFLLGTVQHLQSMRELALLSSHMCVNSS